MYSNNFSLRFSGHQTFALRYGWLNKSYNMLSYNGKSDEELVVSLGVGKNMVDSIKYWTEISGLRPLNAKENFRSKYITSLADIFEKYDSYLEMDVSTWLLHYFIQKNFKELNFSRWYFNFSNKQIFDKYELVSDLIDWLESADLKVPSLATLQKDLDCFLLCYSKRLSGKKLNEDAFISPLNELNLIYQIESHKFKADLVEQKNLPVRVFLYCLVDYWKENLIQSPTISVDSVATNPGSPGRLYRLNNTAVDYFLNQCALIDERFKWTDTLGMRSLSCDQISEINLEELLSNIYRGKN